MIWVKVLLKQETIGSDFVKMLKVKNKKICLVKHQENFYALQNNCPHAGGILSSGWCIKGNIVCPIHRYQYNLTTGRGAQGQGDYVNTYQTELRPDGLYVAIKQNWLAKIFGSK